MGIATIRPIVRDDLAALKAVIDANELFPSEKLDEMVAPYFLGADESRWLTAVVDAELAAVAYYVPERMTRGTWNLLLIAVLPARQGSGIGTAVMRHIESELAADGQRVLIVETSGVAAFTDTRAFYRHIGYEEEARIRDFYETGDDKVIFRKVLRPKTR